MQPTRILDHSNRRPPATVAQRAAQAAARLQRARWPAILLLVALGIAACGCRKDLAAEASDSDANGYFCMKCRSKLYTTRSVFIGPQCPKCGSTELLEVVGYTCPKDNHVTILPRSNDRGAPVCEQCQEPLSGMRLPREKELIAWGATKAP